MADYNKDFKRPDIELLSQEELEENSKSIAGLWSLVERAMRLIKKEELTPEIVAQKESVSEKVSSFKPANIHESFSIALMKDELSE